jgi:hypothetical protein
MNGLTSFESRRPDSDEGGLREVQTRGDDRASESERWQNSTSD